MVWPTELPTPVAEPTLMDMPEALTPVYRTADMARPCKNGDQARQ